MSDAFSSGWCLCILRDWLVSHSTYYATLLKFLIWHVTCLCNLNRICHVAAACLCHVTVLLTCMKCVMWLVCVPRGYLCHVNYVCHVTVVWVTWLERVTWWSRYTSQYWHLYIFQQLICTYVSRDWWECYVMSHFYICQVIDKSHVTDVCHKTSKYQVIVICYVPNVMWLMFIFWNYVCVMRLVFVTWLMYYTWLNLCVSLGWYGVYVTLCLCVSHDRCLQDDE